MTTTLAIGRLGNQIIRNLAVSLIAEKSDLFVTYVSYDKIRELGIPLYIGKKTYENTMPLTDENYMDIFSQKHISVNLEPNGHFFQTKEITQLLYSYLHSDSIKQCITDKNPWKNRYNNNNDLFIHIRLTDAAQFNPGVSYYLHAISSVVFDNLFITTDEPTHPIIKEIMQVYSTCKIISCDEVITIQFGSTCKNVILSHGSFSAIIGYLSFYSNVYYPEFDDNKIWHGDMFSIDGWKKLDTSISFFKGVNTKPKYKKMPFIFI